MGRAPPRLVSAADRVRLVRLEQEAAVSAAGGRAALDLSDSTSQEGNGLDRTLELLGARLVEAREARRLSQRTSQQLALAACLCPTGSVVNASRAEQVLERLAQIYGVALSDLLDPE